MNKMWDALKSELNESREKTWHSNGFNLGLGYALGLMEAIEDAVKNGDFNDGVETIEVKANGETFSVEVPK